MGSEMCIRDRAEIERAGKGIRKTHGIDAAPQAGVAGACDAFQLCLLYTSDAADERSSVDLGGRRIIKKKRV